MPLAKRGRAISSQEDHVGDWKSNGVALVAVLLFSAFVAAFWPISRPLISSGFFQGLAIAQLGLLAICVSLIVARSDMAKDYLRPGDLITARSPQALFLVYVLLTCIMTLAIAFHGENAPKGQGGSQETQDLCLFVPVEICVSPSPLIRSVIFLNVISFCLVWPLIVSVGRSLQPAFHAYRIGVRVAEDALSRQDFEFAATRFLAVRDLAALGALLDGLRAAISQTEGAAKEELDALGGIVEQCFGDRQAMRLVGESMKDISLHICTRPDSPRSDIIDFLQIQIRAFKSAHQQDCDAYFVDIPTSIIVSVLENLYNSGVEIDLSVCWQELGLIFQDRSLGSLSSWDNCLRCLASITITDGALERGGHSLLMVWTRVLPVVEERNLILRWSTCSRVARTIISVRGVKPHGYEEFIAKVFGLGASNLNRIAMGVGGQLQGKIDCFPLLDLANQARRVHKDLAEMLFLIEFVRIRLDSHGENTIETERYASFVLVTRLLKTAVSVPVHMWWGGESGINPNSRVADIVRRAYRMVI